MNRKGQALIEFVLILPILILILFAIFDFGNIFYSKYELQNQSSDIIRLVRKDSSEDEIKSIYDKIDVSVSDYKDDYKKVIITKDVNVMTPLLDRLLGDPYLIKVERVIFDE